jgi:hypothetical protein
VFNAFAAALAMTAMIPCAILIVTVFCTCCRGLGFAFPGTAISRGVRFAFLGFPGVIGYIPSGSFEVERTMGNELVKFARTMSAFGQRFVRKLLNDFFDLAALMALILVDRHSLKFLLVLTG